MDPLIFTYLWEEAKVNLNQCYRKERVNSCYFNVAIARDSDQVQTPVVQGATWRAQGAQGPDCFSAHMVQQPLHR